MITIEESHDPQIFFNIPFIFVFNYHINKSQKCALRYLTLSRNVIPTNIQF